MYYLVLLRIKHYIKNLLIFIPMFFGGEIFNGQKLYRAILGFVCFCLLSSSIYIFNDYRDIENDRLHPTKKFRPLASGKVSPLTALFIMILCLVITSIFTAYLRNIAGSLCLILYFCLNLLYSIGLKNRPIIDIVILAAGFVIRIFYGGFITEIPISQWMYLVIVSGSLYMGLGKRRNELHKQTSTRNVLKYYSIPFLDKNMYVCVALANVFYALWTLDMMNKKIVWTVPIFIILLMRYSYDIEGMREKYDGDPTEVILHDYILVGIIILYALCIFLLLYVL